jgi:hypothetical protein
MSASLISWSDWIASVIGEARRLAAEVEDQCNSEVHPAGRAAIAHWQRDILQAGHQGDLGRVQALARQCHDRIEKERRWYAESLATADRKQRARPRHV